MLENQLEAILFWQAEPQSVKKLARVLAANEPDVQIALSRLSEQLANRGIRLVTKNDEVTLGTAPEVGESLERLAKAELKAELGRAGLETMTIVAYRGPVAKSEIDYLRGVDSGFTLRHLLVRGLIEKIPNPEDGRGSLYQPTFELMSLLGLVRLNELPDYNEIKSQLDNFLKVDESQDEPQTN